MSEQHDRHDQRLHSDQGNQRSDDGSGIKVPWKFINYVVTFCKNHQFMTYITEQNFWIDFDTISFDKRT